MNNLKIIKSDLLEVYLEQISGLQPKFEALKEAEISTDTFSFYTSVASVFSSKIEGEDIELDSYIKHKAMHLEFKPDYTKKTDDLYNAYQFAQSHPLNAHTITEAHILLSKNIVERHKQGKLRTNIMYVATDDGRIEYVATSPYELKAEMEKWFADVEVLLNTSMSAEEVFFYAAMLHLTFVKIHPWNDGNGRSARLIEKWFIAQKLGEKAWFLQSEKNYYNQHALYYTNLRKLGLEYQELDYNQALPFLLMLPKCLEL
jgi:Fic family protein